MFNSIVGVFTIEVMLFICNFFSNKIKVIHTAINDNNSTVFQEETLMVEVVFKGWVFNIEIHTDTLESRIVPGIYFVGELLDVDGICGGYTL